MTPTISMVVLSSLATSTIITMSSYHWLMAWIGLEINTLAMIPIISTTHHPRSTEAATKYFLIQATASALILFSSMTNAWHTGSWDITQMVNKPSNIMLTVALAMKLGLVPLHFWLPEVIQGSTTTTALIIMTWQKLAPMSLIFLTMNNLSTTVLLLLGLLSSMVGGWGGLNQTQVRKIMAYSSIAHLGWMSSISSIMPNLLTTNLVIYIIMTTSTFFPLIITKAKTIQNMTTAWTLSPMLIIIAMLSLLSLGGLPPLAGFIPKWLIMEELISQNFNLFTTMMALSSLLGLFFYLRLTYSTTLTLSPNMAQTKFKWRFYPNMMTSFFSTFFLISTLLLPLTPLILV
uniref:NADH-ubiquinone oxidoreductase chain 2 n=1 Tax=Anolis sp. SBH266328 TaxID=323618 RepID=Q2M4B5_9SAUR|nr:NADH dehydrogenase subunit 2 [Anolis sp. SBH266328]